MYTKTVIGPMLKHEKLLLSDPVIVTVNKFDEESASKFALDCCKAVELGMPFIPVVIDSFGGGVYSLLSMIETIRSSPVPVATVILGKAMSCGAMLAAMGTRGFRYISPYAYILMHHVSSWSDGIAPKIREDAKQTDNLDRQIFGLVSDNCGHRWDYFIDLLKEKEGADWYINPSQSMELGLTDHLCVPTLSISITAKMELIK